MAGTDQHLTQLVEVERKYRKTLLKKQHVVGVSVGPIRENGKVTGEYALIVLVDEKVPLDRLAQQDQIPSTLDGVPVKIYEVGVLEAL